MLDLQTQTEIFYRWCQYEKGPKLVEFLSVELGLIAIRGMVWYSRFSVQSDRFWRCLFFKNCRVYVNVVSSVVISYDVVESVSLFGRVEAAALGATCIIMHVGWLFIVQTVIV